MKTESLKLWAFYYNPMIHESASYIVSYHRTKAGAIKAMNAHKAEEKKDFDRMTSREENKLYKLKFGLFEEWSVHRFELIISD